mgnify:CR=1 FL=1
MNKVINLQHKLKELALQDGEFDSQQRYEQHFSDISEQLLVKTAKGEHVDSITAVKDEMRQLFGKEPTEVKKSMVAEEDLYEYRLSPELKKLENVVIKGTEYCCNSLFQKTIGTVRFDDSMTRTMIRSYRDYVFVENKEEQTINNFRSEFVQHALNHLKLCGASEKSKGFTNSKILILTPFMGDARAIVDMIVEQVGLPTENR